MAIDRTRLAEEIKEKIAHDAVLYSVKTKSFVSIILDPHFMTKVFMYMKKDKGCELLLDIVGTHQSEAKDDPQSYIELIYRISTLSLHDEIHFKISLRTQELKCKSVKDIWSSAEWLEREVSEMLGVEFEGNKNQSAFLLPEGWVGHPLRKEYVYPESFDAIERQREPIRKQHSRA